MHFFGWTCSPTTSMPRKVRRETSASPVHADPAKRSVYDTVGKDGLKNAGNDWSESRHSQGVDPFQMFRDFFGDNFHFSFSSKERGEAGRRRAERRKAAPLFKTQDPVVILNSHNFKAHVGRKSRKASVWLAFFHDRERESALLARKVKQVATSVKGIARVGTIDCTQAPRVCAGQEADFLPSLRVLSQNGSAYYKGKKDVPSITAALHAALPDWVHHFGNRRSQATFERLAANGTMDEGMVILFSADQEPPAVLKAQASKYPPRQPKPIKGSSLPFHPRFSLVSTPQVGRVNASQQGIAKMFNLTALPQLVMFRPAINTSAGHPLMDFHYTAGVLGQYSGPLEDANAIRKWVKSFAPDWTATVVNASRSVGNRTADRLQGEQVHQRQEWAKIRESSNSHTLMNVSADSFRSCLDPERAAEIFFLGKQRRVKCLLVLTPTDASTAQAAKSAGAIKRHLAMHSDIPHIRELQLLHVKARPRKTFKWKSGSNALFATTAMSALHSDVASAKVPPAYRTAVQNTLALFERNQEQVTDESEDSITKDVVQDAVVQVAYAYRAHFSKPLTGHPPARKAELAIKRAALANKKKRLAAADELPGMVLVDVNGKGVWEVCSTSARQLASLAEAPREAPSFMGISSHAPPPHEAIGTAIAEFAASCLQGTIPRKRVSPAVAESVQGMARWREVHSSDAKEFLLSAAKQQKEGSEKKE